MPDNIIAEWLNLPTVKFADAKTENNITEIKLSRLPEVGYACSGCGQRTFWSWDSASVRLRDLSIFEIKAYLVLYKHRVNCPCCGVKVEKLDFADYYSRCTIRFEELVARLCKITSLKQVAELLELDWKTVKDIDKKYLQKEFVIPDYENLRLVAIDEISSRKGYNFFTIVMNMEKTKVIWVGKGRTKEVLDQFFKELGPERAQKIEAIAIDMWDPYIASITEHVPDAKAKIVFDKFHVIKNYSKIIDKVRNIEYAKAAAKDKEVIKGTKYLLLKNTDNLKKDQKQQLQDLLGLNEKINLVYILKDDLKRLWNYSYRKCAEDFLDSWIEQAKASDIRSLKQFGKTLDGYRYGLINHCDYPIDTAKLEGMNNKIKVVKRIAYGFHDDDYFILKIKQACSGH